MTDGEVLAIDYDIDGDDRLVRLGDGWEPFARRNGATGLSPERLLGEALWSFVRNPALGDVYRHLVGRARREGSVVTFPYRCDSPWERRWCEMTITPADDAPSDDHVRFVSRIVRREPWPALGVLHDRLSGALLTRCSVCNRYRVRSTWLEVEDALTGGLILQSPGEPHIVHGFCGACRLTLRADHAARGG